MQLRSGALLAIGVPLAAGTAAASGFDAMPTPFQIAMLSTTCILTCFAGLLQPTSSRLTLGNKKTSS